MTQTALTREQVLKATGTVLDVMIAVHIFKEPVAPLYLPMIMRDKRYYFIPEYSTDISAAWEVEEKILQNHSGVRTRYVWRLKLVTDWEDKQPHNREEMKLIHATPEQRCKAALLAVLDI